MSTIQSVKPQSKQNYKDEKEIEEGFFGIIEIDKIKIKLPIYSDVTENNLYKGVGILKEYDIPNEISSTVSVIAGHRGGYNGNDSFLNLDKLENGDLVKVNSLNKHLTYKVMDKFIVNKSDWSKFKGSHDNSYLYLLTCYPYPIDKERLIIKCQLI